MMLSPEEIDELLQILKEIKYDKEYFKFPEKGESEKLDVISLDGKKKFIIDITPGSKRSNPKKVTYQERFLKDIVLLRLDLYGQFHTNPDGEKISENHLHIIKHGYDDKFAYEIPKEFINIDDKIDTLINFLEYCKIKNPRFANIERSMF